MFDDEDNMIIPMSIDDIDASKGSYYKSTNKMVIAFVGLLPYIFLVIFLYSVMPSIPLVVTFTLMYLVLYLYVIRKFVIEEDAQKESLHELQDNKYSDFSYFWEIDKVGDNKEKDDGLLYLRQDGVTLKRGLVVFFDSGSVVGTPDDFLHNYRETQQKFLRAFYQNKLSFKWYKVKKQAELNPALIKQSEQLSRIDNEALRQLLKLQLNAYLRYSMDAEQRYVDYIVITNKDFSTLMNFKNVVEDIVNNTLRTNPAFKDVKILNKNEVDEFFATYFLQDDVDTNSISKSTRSKPFSEYAKVTEIVDRDGEIVDIALLDILNSQIEKDSIGTSIQDVFDAEDRKSMQIENKRKQEYDFMIKKLNKDRIDDKLTHEEYLEQLKVIEHTYSKEFYNPNRAEEEKQAEKERRKQERENARLEKEKARQKPEPIPEPKWYEKVSDTLEEEEDTEVLDTDDWNNDEQEFDLMSVLREDSDEEVKDSEDTDSEGLSDLFKED